MYALKYYLYGLFNLPTFYFCYFWLYTFFDILEFCGGATLAGRAVGGRDRDRAGDQEERALLLKSYRVRRGAL